MIASIKNGLSASLLAAVLLAQADSLLACAEVEPQHAVTTVTAEEAAIIWDAKTHTEHFIRRAGFQSNAKDFGFLVPTPEPPKIAKGTSALFEALNNNYLPKYIDRPVHGFKLSSFREISHQLHHDEMMTVKDSEEGFTPRPTVQAVRIQNVAGYDATVLHADDASALVGWLRSHGYETRPALIQWLQPYVTRHWSITAFKIAGAKNSSSQTAIAPVDLSFHTPKPFFPYSEPADQRTPGAHASDRILRVFMLSGKRMDAKLDSPSATWLGTVAWAKVLNGDIHRRGRHPELESEISLHTETIPDPLWLTTFEDKSSPRQGVADLIFTPSISQVPLAPPPVDHPIDMRKPIPVEPFVGSFLLVGALALRKRRSSK